MWVGRVVLEECVFTGFSVEQVKAVLCADPQQPVMIYEHGKNHIISQAVLLTRYRFDLPERTFQHGEFIQPLPVGSYPIGARVVLQDGIDGITRNAERITFLLLIMCENPFIFGVDSSLAHDIFARQGNSVQPATPGAYPNGT